MMVRINNRTFRIYDHPALYDGERLAADAAREPNAIIEGFAAMIYPGVIRLVSVHFHLDVSWTICATRRRNRPDHRKSDESWHALGRDWHCGIQMLQRNLADTILLDQAPVDQWVEQVSAVLNMPAARSTARL
jgi:hypothetical protein